MGLFSGPSKDAADRKFQEALNVINAVKAPTVDSQKVQLAQLVQQGLLTPEDVQAYLQEDSGLNDIEVDPRFRQAQVDVLKQLQDISSEGGLTAIDRARLQDIFDQENAEERGARLAIEQDARERGIAGSEFSLANKAIANQEAANRAARSGMEVEALAEQRVLDTLAKQAELGGNLESMDFNEQAQIAAAQDAINQFNAATKNQVAQINTGAHNLAQEKNLGEKQRVSDVNVTNDNSNRVRNADLIQKKFDNEMRKAEAAAGVYSQWGANNQANANAKYGAKMGLVGAGLGAGATLLSGGMAAPLMSSPVSSIGSGNTTNSMYNNPYMLPSDVTNKEDISPADVDLDEFMITLQPYKYQYKDKAKFGEGDHHGVMAQDLLKSKPGAEIVTKTDDGLAIDTNKGFGLLAASIGRLNKKIEEKHNG